MNYLIKQTNVQDFASILTSSFLILFLLLSISQIPGFIVYVNIYIYIVTK